MEYQNHEWFDMKSFSYLKTIDIEMLYSDERVNQWNYLPSITSQLHLNLSYDDAYNQDFIKNTPKLLRLTFFGGTPTSDQATKIVKILENIPRERKMDSLMMISSK